MSSPEYEVAIVGCGPVGMVLTALLAREGVHVLALEREEQLGYRPRARHIDGEAMRVLQKIGVAEASERIMRPLGGFRLVDAEGRTLLEQPVDNTGPGPQGWFADYQMYQPLLLQLLYEHLSGRDRVAIRTSQEVTSLDQRDDHVALVVKNRSAETVDAVTARYVVGCDGADSWVRQTIGCRFQSLGPDHPYVVIDATPLRPSFSLPEPTYSINVCDPTRPHYVSPGSASVPIRFEFMVMPGDDAAELVTPAGIARLTERYLSDGDVRFDRAAVYVFHSLLVEQWRVGRVLLAGDAAHVQPPFMGQGLCSGFRDAANLAWKLAMVCRGDADGGLLDSYQSERAPHARDWINEANRIGAIVMTTDPDEAAARDERLLGGDFTELRPIAPTLGPGLHGSDEPPAGTLAPQPFLPDGRRLDELIGNRFLLTAIDEVWLNVGEKLRRGVERTPDVVDLIPTSDEKSPLLSHYESRAVLVRPDRYVLGVASDSKELERILRRIPSLIHPALTHGA